MRTPVTSIESLEHIKNEYNKRKAEYQYQILVCAGAGCISSDCESVKTAVIDEIKALSMDSQIEVYETGCMGTCAVGPVMLILPERIFYTNLTPEAAKYIIRSHVMEHTIPVEYTFFDHTLQKYIPHIDDISFFREQVRIALRNCGILDYSSIDAYIAANGYFAAALALTQMSSEDVIREIKLSKQEPHCSMTTPRTSAFRSSISPLLVRLPLTESGFINRNGSPCQLISSR
jgi:NADH-quinone oxidoreductase subunit F